MISLGHMCLKRASMRISSHKEKMRKKNEKRQWIRGRMKREENRPVT